MYAFMNAVTAQRGIHLSNYQADLLIASAKLVIDAINDVP